MENRIKKRVNNFTNNFKDDLIRFINTDDFNKQSMCKLISEYPRLLFDPDDFSKRKRVKNFVPEHDRCIAKRANTEQCTRRKKDNTYYCGTHLKGRPHGEMNKEDIPKKKKVELTIKNLNGIPQYVDETGKCYSAETVLNLNKNKL